VFRSSGTANSCRCVVNVNSRSLRHVYCLSLLSEIVDISRQLKGEKLMLQQHSISTTQNFNKIVGGFLNQYQDKFKRIEEEKESNIRLAHEREFIEELLLKMLASDRFNPKSNRTLQIPIEKTAGDLVLSSFRPGGSQHILLGDFTGHGLQAAIGSPLVADIFYSMTKKGLHGSEILTEINNRLNERMPISMFMTAGLLELDSSRLKLKVWNCAMPDILIYRAGVLHQQVQSAHFARGMIDKPDGPGTLVDVLPGDKVYVYSDGIIEEMNEDGMMFGRKSLELVLTKMLALDNSLEVIRTALDDFRGIHHNQNDDVSIIELTC
jgi:two-component system, HptB-dependent secretion and biofilm response regulator